MARRTKDFIFSSSPSVGGRSSKPISWIRTVVAPTKDATLVEMPLFSNDSKYSLKVVQSISYLNSVMSASCCSLILSFKGPMDHPSPNTSNVTPCLMSLKERPSAMRDVVAQLSILIKPGETANPFASISIFPLPGKF